MTKAADFKVVERGLAACIRLSPEVEDQFKSAIGVKDELSIKRKVHFNRIFKEFCSNARPRLNDQQFKKEGDFPDGSGRHVAIFAIKARQFRIYGTLCTVDGQKCFIGVKVDAAKKQDKADQALLKATAKKLGDLDEFKDSAQKIGSKDDQRTKAGGNHRNRR